MNHKRYDPYEGEYPANDLFLVVFDAAEIYFFHARIGQGGQHQHACNDGYGQGYGE